MSHSVLKVVGSKQGVQKQNTAGYRKTRPTTREILTTRQLSHRLRHFGIPHKPAEKGGQSAGKAGDEWLGALSHLGTDWEKPFLETAPWLIGIFGQRWGTTTTGEKFKHYYVPESVGIASGFLIAALHEFLLYEQIKPLVDGMLRRQPDNADLQALGAWIASRLAN